MNLKQRLEERSVRGTPLGSAALISGIESELGFRRWFNFVHPGLGFAAAAIATLVLVGGVLIALRPNTTPVAPSAAPTTTVASSTTTTTATTLVETTEPERTEPVVQDAGPAHDAGWTQVDVGGARFVELSLGYPARYQVVGYVDWGLAMRNVYGELVVRSANGEIEHDLEMFADRQIYGFVARAGSLWAEVEAASIGPPQHWVSSDGESWSLVTVRTPDGLAPTSTGDVLFDTLIHMRFLERGDRVLAISGFGGLIGGSSDGGKTFTVGGFPDEPDEVGSGAGRAWATSEGFYVERRGILWRSGDGLTWDEVAEISGLPDWDEGIAGTSPESFVAQFDDGSLWTMEFDFDNKGLFRSDDGGITWSLVPGPYPFADVSAPLTSQGWMHFAEQERVWVSADGYNWYWIDGHTDGWAQPASGVVLTSEGSVVAPPGSPLVEE